MPCQLEATSEHGTKIQNNIEMVSYHSFKRAAKSGQYQDMYLTFLDTPEVQQ